LKARPFALEPYAYIIVSKSAFAGGVLVMYALALPILCLGAESEAQALLEQGDRQSRAGDLDAAFSSYQRAVEKDPQSADAHMKLGGLQLARRDYTSSIQSFQTVVRLAPDNANAFVGLGMAYLHLGSYSRARAAFQEALKRDPSKQADIQNVLDWIDVRSGADAPSAEKGDAAAQAREHQPIDRDQ
jgi:Flp pilus assembly protein TadD